MDIDLLQESAIELLESASVSFGIVASPDAQENYQRLWSRDAMLAGIAGLSADNQTISDAFKASIRTLSQYQHPRGMIPSNVRPDQKKADISYGGLAGRVDATTWFVVGSCFYLLKYQDEDLKDELQPHLQSALNLLDRWEFNGRGLLYTPLSGNWADEYPIQGHTLYDNCLRLWALSLYASCYKDETRSAQAADTRKLIILNFWPDEVHAQDPAVYHARAFNEATEKDRRHYACAIDPSGYNECFDAAGHGLALLQDLPDKQQLETLQCYTEDLFAQLNHDLLPAFWPVISPGDHKWEALKANYSYDFKNYPHKFHNGGIWPVWMGLFGLGMSLAGHPNTARKMLESWIDLEDLQIPDFHEYIDSDTFQPGGKQRLSYSASGLLFLIESINPNSSLRQLLALQS